MKSKVMNIAIFILSTICFIISVKLFINMIIFSDEYNTSPMIICGGELWLYLNWIKIGLLFIISFILGIKAFLGK